MKKEQQYIDLYRETQTALKMHAADVLNTRRETAFEQFCQTGFPTKNDENYRYCPLFEALGTDYGFDVNRIAAANHTTDQFKCDVPGIRAHNFFTLNEQWIAPTKQTLPQGVIFCSLSDACRQHTDIVKRYFGKQTHGCVDGFVLFNEMFAQDGFFLYVPENVIIDTPIQLVNMLQSGSDLMACSRNLMILENGAQCTILACDHAAQHVNYMVNRVTEIFVNENAHLEYDALESTHEKVHKSDRILIDQQDHSHVTANMLGLRNGNTRNHIEINLNGPHAKTQLGGMVINDGAQHTDNHTVIRHNTSHCTSNELFKYILDSNADSAFYGKILVAKNAQHTEAYQTNRNICLTKTARMHANPQLEIYADDVKCGHGAATGQLDENALFYMQTRGIGAPEARMLLLLAFTADIMERISVEAVRDRLRLLVEQRLRGAEPKCKNCLSHTLKK